MLTVWLTKTVWSPQAIWTEISHFFPWKYLNKDSKKGVAEPFFQFPVLKYPFKGLFRKGRINFHILLQNPGSNSEILGALQNPGSYSKTLGAIPKPWEHSKILGALQNPESYSKTLGAIPKPWEHSKTLGALQYPKSNSKTLRAATPPSSEETWQFLNWSRHSFLTNNNNNHK